MSLPWYLAGALALGCAGLGLWTASQSATIDAKEATIKERDATIVLKDQQILQAKKTNTDNEATLATLRAERDAASSIAAEFDAQSRARDAKLAATLEKLSRGPASEDGPVPMVLERALDVLREGSPAADRPDSDRGGASPAPGRKAEVSDRQAAAACKAAGGDDVCLLRRGLFASP